MYHLGVRHRAQRSPVPLPEDAGRADAGAAVPRQASHQRERLTQPGSTGTPGGGLLEEQVRRSDRSTGGYSALARLSTCPVDVIKIDRSLLADIGTPRGEAVPAGIITLAHATSAQVIAEGVETKRAAGKPAARTGPARPLGLRWAGFLPAVARLLTVAGCRARSTPPTTDSCG
jgi:EAL domain-containing protein